MEADQQAAVSSSAPSEAAPVEDELTLLRRAKARIAANDPEGALETLDEHTKSYPRGMFVEEAAAVRVEAFVAMGDGTRAQKAGDAFPARTRNGLEAKSREPVIEIRNRS